MNFSTFIFLINASYPAYAGTFMTTLIRILALQYENAFPQTFVFALPFLMKVFVIALAVRTIKNPVMKLRYFSKSFIGLAESIRCYFIAYKSTFVLYPYLLGLLLLSVDQVITSEVSLLANQASNKAYRKPTAFGNLLTRALQSATPFSAALILSETASSSGFFFLAISVLYGFVYPCIRSRHLTIHTEPREHTNETIIEDN